MSRHQLGNLERACVDLRGCWKNKPRHDDGVLSESFRRLVWTYDGAMPRVQQGRYQEALIVMTLACASAESDKANETTNALKIEKVIEIAGGNVAERVFTTLHRYA